MNEFLFIRLNGRTALKTEVYLVPLIFTRNIHKIYLIHNINRVQHVSAKVKTILFVKLLLTQKRSGKEKHIHIWKKWSLNYETL